jgi:hypothetical protein
MADLDSGTLFSVNGLVAVITGGGTGDDSADKDQRLADGQQALD